MVIYWVNSVMAKPMFFEFRVDELNDDGTQEYFGIQMWDHEPKCGDVILLTWIDGCRKNWSVIISVDLGLKKVLVKEHKDGLSGTAGRSSVVDCGSTFDCVV